MKHERRVGSVKKLLKLSLNKDKIEKIYLKSIFVTFGKKVEIKNLEIIKSIWKK